MEYLVDKIPQSKVILVPVADEQIEVEFVTDIKVIKCGFEVYKVFGAFSYEKGEMFPKQLFHLATGVELKDESIWKKYPRSKKVYLFICEKDDTIKELPD